MLVPVTRRTIPEPVREFEDSAVVAVGFCYTTKSTVRLRSEDESGYEE